MFFNHFFAIRDDTHTASIKIVQLYDPLLRPSPPPCPSKSKILLLPSFWTFNFKLPFPLPFLKTTNQLKENIVQRWLLYVTRSFLHVGFCFQYQLINLIWLCFDFFPFSWSLTICFPWLHALVCAVVQKNRKVFFIYNYSSFYYSFCNQSVLFAQLENVNKLRKNRTVHASEQNQKGWLNCLRSESKGRFFVNNILMFGSAWWLLITQLPFFFKDTVKQII